MAPLASLSTRAVNEGGRAEILGLIYKPGMTSSLAIADYVADMLA